MIYFSNFAKTSSMICPRVSIARYTPTWVKCKTYLDLAPSEELLKSKKSGKIDEAEYTRQFNIQLSKLDIDKVISDLSGKVLVCYCKSDQFCHRHIVRAWLSQKTQCKEL